MRPGSHTVSRQKTRPYALLAATLALCALLLAGPSAPLRAEGERAGEFDYYVLSLSWSPTWCALEGKARGAPQCRPGRRLGWVLHGLWPQYERGWPSYCRTSERNPSRAETGAMADLMGSSGAAWYQWKKHGRCSGLSPDAYYETARKAFGRIRLPDGLARAARGGRIDARKIEAAFLAENPNFSADSITVTCKKGRIQEVRICLDRELSPRSCSADVVQDCTLEGARFDRPQ